MRLGTEVAADGASITGAVTGAAAMCTPLGEQRSIVLLVTMPGTPAPAITPSSVNEMFFASAGRSVSEFWRENSYGQAWAQGDVAGWFTLDANYSCDQTSEIRDAAIRAADSVVDFTQYSRIFIVVAGIDGSCGWAGVGTVGCGSLSSPGDGRFTASTSWMLSSVFDTRDHGVKLAIHEGGHNLGLNHASSRDFGSDALGAPGVTGSLNEYGDEYSTMGTWTLGHYAAPHKAKLGWLTSDMQTVTGNGSFSLQPAEAAGALHALKIRRGIDNNNWLWLEYRNPIGNYDSTLNSLVFGGGLIHYEDPLAGLHTHVLDFTPQTDSWSDPVLTPGKNWSDPYTNVSIAVDGASTNALSVRVDYGPLPCVEAAPAVSISPLNPSAYPGDNVPYTVTVTNNDSLACAPRTFNLSSIIPGWPTSFSQNSLVVSPSTTSSATMSKLVPAGTAPATYSVDATVTTSNSSTHGAGNLTVLPSCGMAAPTLNLSPSNPNAYPGNAVTYTVVIANNDSAACASRTFSLSSSVPAWVTTFSQNPLVIPPSTTAFTTMSKLVPASTAPGAYAVDVLVATNGWSASSTVTVTVSAPCLAAAPTVTLSPSNMNAFPGDTVTYTMGITNNDTASCSPRSFNLSSTLPNWVTTFSQNDLTLLPLATASTTMSKIVPAGTTAGTYSVGATVTSNGSSTDGSASMTVVAPCVKTAPTVVLSPSTLSASPGDNVTYTVTVTNRDAALCAGRTFNLTSSLPAWPTVFSPTSLNLGPGSTSSATMTKTISLETALGSYLINARAADGASGGDAAASVTVQAPPASLAVSVSVAGSTFTKGATVLMTARVLLGGAAVPGASVQFAMIYPNSSTATKRLTTDSNGQAVWSYKVATKDPKGTYRVSAQATSGSQTVNSVPLSFSVQ